MKIRYNDKFKFIMDIDYQTLDKAIIKMSLQPLIENAIYHGIRKKEGHGIIKMKIYQQNDTILIHILDNGIGISAKKLEDLRSHLRSASTHSSHIGLLNTNRRLHLVYGDSYTIHLYSRQQKGTIVSFSFPVESLDTE